MQKLLLSDLGGFARQVADILVSKEVATVLALRGDLGAGKTTFTQALAKELGVTETVQSPTYVLMKKYRTSNSKFQTLIHVDAYRLESPKEFAALKPEQFLHNPKTLIVIEWPERLGSVLPKPDTTINFSSDGAKEGERYIEVV